MEKLVTGLWSQFSPQARKRSAEFAALDRMIDKLQEKEDGLKVRLEKQQNNGNHRHLHSELEAAKLQHKKAVAVRRRLRGF